MRTFSALLIVSALAASLASCGTPTAVESDLGSVTTSPTPQTGTTDSSAAPATPADPNTSSGTSSPTPSNPTTGLCGTSATAITYSGQAQAVIAANCTICHNATSPVMTDFDSSKKGFEDGGAKAVANGVMPISITLSDNDKCILTQWSTNGYAK